jgi:hypothetical protein
MTYEPFARGGWAIFLYLFGGVLLILGLLVTARAQKSGPFQPILGEPDDARRRSKRRQYGPKNSAQREERFNP